MKANWGNVRWQEQGPLVRQSFGGIRCRWHRDARSRLMKHLGMLAGNPQPRPTTHHLFGDGNLDQVISAEVAGYFRAEVKLLDEVKSGQRVGLIRDLFGNVIQEVNADQDGIVIMLRRFHRVHVGDGLAHLTGFVERF